MRYTNLYRDDKYNKKRSINKYNLYMKEARLNKRQDQFRPILAMKKIKKLLRQDSEET